MGTVVVVATCGIWLLALLLVAIGIRQYRIARRREEELRWVGGQLERAVVQIESGDEEEILAGLQTVAALRDRKTYMHLLPIVSRIAQRAATKRVREAADLTLSAVVGTLSAESKGAGASGVNAA